MSHQSEQDWPSLEDSETSQPTKSADQKLQPKQPIAILRRDLVDQQPTSVTPSTQTNTKLSFEERERMYNAVRDELFGPPLEKSE